jgi:uncharacterized protein YjiS (DUF1127 family)
MVPAGAMAMLAGFRRSKMTVIPFEVGRARRVGSRRARHERWSIGGRIVETLREWRQRARDRGQLAGLDDRMLRDIGLTRADAEFLSNKPFWRR